jgi:hypothetical protein
MRGLPLLLLASTKSILPLFQMFDEFEGDEYFKDRVQAELDSGGTCDAVVYLWQDSLHSYLCGEWDPQTFSDVELPRYVAMCERFAADVRQQRGWKGRFLTSPSEAEEVGGQHQHAAGASTQ